MTAKTHNKKLDCTPEEAKRFIGKSVLVGLTYMSSENEVEKEEEFHGTIVRVNSKEGIVVKLSSSKQERLLPPQVSRLEMMRPGNYKICSTGETVTDPDFSGVWVIYSKK
jgi:hypothetical protein